jgi:hypothetical protein
LYRLINASLFKKLTPNSAYGRIIERSEYDLDDEFWAKAKVGKRNSVINI